MSIVSYAAVAGLAVSLGAGGTWLIQHAPGRTRSMR